jgi:hypothetical protein
LSVVVLNVFCKGSRAFVHVFVYGSKQEKLKRVQHLYPRSASERDLREVDSIRAAYIRTYYECDWADRHLYHLMINSDFGIQSAESIILAASGLFACDLDIARRHA